MKTKWGRYFVLSAGGILLGAALIRFIIAEGDAQALSLPEPLVRIPLRLAVVVTGAVELTVALVCLFGKRIELQIGWLVSLATAFVIYRIGLTWTHCHPQGTCLGSLTDPLHLARGAVGGFMEFIPFYLVFGSYAACLWLWLSKGTRTARRIAPQQHADVNTL
jgi:hypothetical protein